MHFPWFSMPGTSYNGSFLPLNAEELKVRDLLQSIVQKLAGNIGIRNIKIPGSLEAAAAEILTYFESISGLISEQSYRANDTVVKNIILEKTGTENAGEIIIIGAHYDTVWGSPGADDNASGVAALLVIAKLLNTISLKKTIRFVAFANEEPPFFCTSKMGSYQYARLCRKNSENIIAMFSLESIGFYSEEKKSQAYPFPFSFFYPNAANFIGFVGNAISHRLVKKSIAAFRENTLFPSEGLFAPFFIPGVALSDQLAFWWQGYKAVMITGTAYLRNPNYHQSTDLPNTLDYHRMARVVHGLSKMFISLATNEL